IPVPGAQALAIDQVGHQVFVGTSSGDIRVVATQPLDEARWHGSQPGDGTARAFTTTGAAIRFLHATPDGGTIVAVEAAAGTAGVPGAPARRPDRASGTRD